MPNKKIQLLVCCCRHWVGERTWSPCLAVAQDICRPSLLHHTCITWFIMSHKWWKSMAVWGSLVDKVFLSIYMSKYMEHVKLNHLLFDDIRYKIIQMNTYFPKSWFSKLWLLKQKLSPHNTIQIPFWWICILRCRDEKWWSASVFSPKEQSLGCSHQPSPSWKTPERTTRTRLGETGIWKKGMKRSKWEEFEQHYQFKLTQNP